MRSPRVVPKQPIHELFVESVNIVREQIPVSRDESIRERTVESFNLRIHLGRTGIRVEVHYALVFQIGFKMIGKFTAVISLNMCEGEWCYRFELLSLQ